MPLKTLNSLLDWSLDKRVLNKLKGTGFDTLRGFDEYLRLNLPLINVLIRRYDADTRSFILGSAENTFNIAFGLEDVLYITGLPIDGKAVTGVDPKDTKSVCQRYLGKHVGYGRKGSVVLSWLKKNFMTLDVDDENLTEEVLAYYVRAYVLYVIGCTFAPSHNLTVSAKFLPLLENVDDIGSYAWGAALLANFHDSMEKLNCSVGFYFPLMIFAYVRFPGLSSTFEIYRAAINAFPLLKSWSHALGLVMRHNCKNQDEEYLGTFFDSLKEGGTGPEEVKWQPYVELSSNFLPQHLREQVVLSKSRTILICFDRAVYHRPDKCQRQLGLAGHILKRDLIDIKTLAHTGKKGKYGTDWSKKGEYSDYVSEWDKRFDLLIDRDDDAFLEDPERESRQFVEDDHQAEASLIAELMKENVKLKDEIKLYRNNYPEHVNRISRIEKSIAGLMENNGLNSRVDDADVDCQSPAGDTDSSRVCNSTTIRSCSTKIRSRDPQIEGINVKKQKVSPSTTTAGVGVGVVGRAEPPPLIIDVESDFQAEPPPLIIDIESDVGDVDRAEPPLIINVESDSDSDVSITDSFMDALVGRSKKS